MGSTPFWHWGLEYIGHGVDRSRNPGAVATLRTRTHPLMVRACPKKTPTYVRAHCVSGIYFQTTRQMSLRRHHHALVAFTVSYIWASPAPRFPSWGFSTLGDWPRSPFGFAQFQMATNTPRAFTSSCAIFRNSSRFCRLFRSRSEGRFESGLSTLAISPPFS